MINERIYRFTSNVGRSISTHHSRSPVSPRRCSPPAPLKTTAGEIIPSVFSRADCRLERQEVRCRSSGSTSVCSKLEARPYLQCSNGIHKEEKRVNPRMGKRVRTGDFDLGAFGCGRILCRYFGHILHEGLFQCLLRLLARSSKYGTCTNFSSSLRQTRK